MKWMIKQLCCFALTTALTTFAMAQNNAIFKGGINDGWNSKNFLQNSTNIFKGGTGDGWNSLNYVQSSSNIFKGGTGDGWHTQNYVQSSTSIFKGGTGDGWHSQNFVQLSTGIFKGGVGDGWSATEPSHDANLSNLTISSGTLVPVFDSLTLNYTASVPFSVTSIAVTPTSRNILSTITVNGTATASGSAKNIALIVGNNTITTIVTAPDGKTVKTYTIIVTRSAGAPSVTTNVATNVATATATLNGTINDNGANTTVTFEYGTSSTLAGATTTSATTNSTINAGSGNTASAVNISGLTPGTLYYFRVKANNSIGTTTGNILSFTTLSNNAVLSNLTISQGTLTPAFASATISYTASVANNVTSIDVTPTKSDANASLTVNGVTTASGSSLTVTLNVGNNTITIIVSAQDGTTKTYTINVTRSAPPATAPSVTTTVATGVTTGSATLNGNVNDNGASTTVTFEYSTSPTLAGSTTVSATTNGTINAGTGNTASAVTITGLASSTTYYFRIKGSNAAGTSNGSILSFTTVTPISSDADLSNLTISQGTLAPIFASGTSNYTASVGNNITSIGVTPTSSNANATITVNGFSIPSGISRTVNLNVGSNTITIIVTAQDGTTKTYTIVVTRAAAPPIVTTTAATNVTITAATLNGIINDNGATTTVSFDYGTSSTLSGATNVAATTGGTVNAGTGNTNSSVNLSGLTPGTVYYFRAKAINSGGTTFGNILSFTTISNNADLSNLAISQGTLTPTFAPATTSYTALVANSVTSVDITPTVSNANATITVNGVTTASGSSRTVTLNIGNNTITTVITAQDGTTKTYTIVITRAAAPPIVTTATATNVTITAATLNGIVNDNGATTTVSFDYGTSSTLSGATNVAATTGGTVNAGSGNTNSSVNLPGLTPGTVYYFRVKAVNSGGTTFGNILSFTTVSNNADLSNLSISQGTLTPTFNPATTTYSLFVPNNVTSINVTPTSSNADATITVNGVATVSGSSRNVTLSVGNNTITVVVTAQDGSIKTYTITVTRGPVTLITDYFRTIQSGNWNAVSTWESSADNINWQPATLTPDFNSNTVTIRLGNSVTVTTNLTIDQTTINNGGGLTVNSGVTLYINDGPDFDVTVNENLSILNGGNMTLRSTASGTASIGNSSGTISGSVTVERYASKRRAWRLLGVPLASSSVQTIKEAWMEGAVNMASNPTPGYGTQITTFSGDVNAANFDAQKPSSSIRKYVSETFNSDAFHTPNTTIPIASNPAYFLFIRGDRAIDRTFTASDSSATTLRMTGDITYGPVTKGIASANFSLIPNPYPSVIDFGLVKSISANSTINTFYVWDASLGSKGQYRTITISGNSYTATPGIQDNNWRFIESGTAFFVPGRRTVDFTEATKASSLPPSSMLRVTGNEPELVLNLFSYDAGNNAILADGIREVFDNTYAATIDRNDAKKISGFDLNLGISSNGEVLAVEQRPIPKHDEIIQLKLWNSIPGNYMFEVKQANLPAGLTAFIKDNYLNTRTLIDAGANNLNFTISTDSASAQSDRFSIVFSKSSYISVYTTSSIVIYPNPAENGVIKLQLNNMPQGKYGLRLLNSIGQTIQSKQLIHAGGTATETMGVNAINGSYMLEITKPDNKKETSKIIIN